ncbi:hypothetical protein [Escherichia coli]|uniref:hypothetical protein n=1 Tax=Escherichia coli TaxID=562 RepID=UPI00235043B5|nr:hypothetical protein [Escherichia coli]MDC7877773.1 hypothetical protein [Escherichia coli]
MSLLEHLSPHYDLSSMFSYELEGRVFRIKLIKPEIKLSRQQLIFSSLFLEKDFLKEYKKQISNTLQKTIKQCIKKYKQKNQSRAVHFRLHISVTPQYVELCIT